MPANTNTKASSSGQQPVAPTYSDEISLFDLWDILAQRRHWVLGVWLLVVLAALAYLFVAQPIFESRAVVQIGKVGGTPITSAAALALELKEHYRVGEPGRERPYLKSVKREGDDALVLEAEAKSGSEAQQFLEQALRALLAAQEQRYQEGRALHEATLSDIEAQLASLNEQIRHLGEVENGRIDDAVKALIVLQRSSLQKIGRAHV